MNSHDRDRIDQLTSELREFKAQYLRDMHGDTVIDDDRGLLPQIRDMKKRLEQYPSLTWLLVHRPHIVFGLFFVLSAIYIDEIRTWVMHNLLRLLGF